MKVLWFTPTASKAAADFGSGYFGGGWISSLESLVTAENKHEIGLCFFYSGTEYKKIIKDGVPYFGIPFEKENSLKRILGRHSGKLNDTRSALVETVLADFKPDLIHVFGTESGFGEILINKFDKVLFHLQGLVAPYTEVYFPIGFDKKNILRNTKIGSLIRGVTFYNYYLILKTRADREIRIIKNWKYFTGRTDWDKNYTNLLNPAATYFHCEEALREIFFSSPWVNPGYIKKKETIVIGTTINPNIYKGLDLIYKVLALLSEYDICWKIFGSKETDDLNTMVKKTLGITKQHPGLKFFGQVNAPQLIEELKACHFFVHPSYIDNSPNSVCEAMLLGMPILSSAVGGVKSLIRHKKDGFLFNPYDKYDLAGLIVYIINNYEVTVEVGNNARKTALKRHATPGILTSLNNIYTTIYNDRSSEQGSIKK